MNNKNVPVIGKSISTLPTRIICVTQYNFCKKYIELSGIQYHAPLINVIGYSKIKRFNARAYLSPTLLYYKVIQGIIVNICSAFLELP